MRMEELSPIFTCHVLAWAGERCVHPLITEAGGRAGPKVIRAGEFSLLLTAIELRRVTHAPCLGNKVELGLIA